MKVLIEVDLDEVEYPDLFRSDIVGTRDAFQNLSLVEHSGFKPVKSINPDILKFLHVNEFGLSADFLNYVYVKNFFTYKIMIIVSKLNDTPETKLCYHVAACILLDHNGELFINTDKHLPSILFYRREGRSGSYLNKVKSNGYAIFNKDYYYFTDIVDIDNYLAEYNSIFRDYNHIKLASTTSNGSDIKMIKVVNSTFYVDENTYNPTVLAEFCDVINSPKFIYWLDIRLSLNKDQIKLISMLAI